MNPLLWIRILLKILEMIAEGMGQAAAIRAAATMFGVGVDEIRRKFC